MSLKLLVKPTNKCNLNCKYCYNKYYENEKDMTIEDIEKIIEMAVETDKDILWIWHGGEPLLMGKDFYIETTKLLHDKGIKRISMQTNGTLIDKEYIEFFKENNISISLSFDGLNNEINRSNTIEVKKAIELLNENEFEFSIIQVVNKDNFRNLVEDYYGFKELGIKAYHMNLIFDSKDKNTLGVDYLKDYLNSFKDLLNTWVHDSSPIFIRNFGEFISYMLGGSEYMCSRTGKCSNSWFGINPNGSLYPCDRWVDFPYGNIKDFNSFEEVRHTERFLDFKSINDTRKIECKKCDIYEVCKGGCPVNAILDNGGLHPNKVRCNYIKGETSIIFNAIKNIDYNIENKELVRTLQDLQFRDMEVIEKLEKYRELQAKQGLFCEGVL